MARSAVAQRLDPAPPRAGRSLEERFWMRFPGLYRAAVGLGWRLLEPRSRLRQTVLRRQVASGFAAASRQDWELATMRYRPDVVYEFNEEMVTLGLPPRVSGRESWVAALDEFAQPWERVTYSPLIAIDLHERMVNLGRMTAHGATSDAVVEQRYAQVIDVADGMAAAQRDFLDWGAALRAAGLDAGIIPRLDALRPGEALSL